MGWSCGQLWQYAADYWEDGNVAQCRKSEARSVCKELFDLSCDNADNFQHIEQDSTGVNLLTFNAFGEEHGVSHSGFFFTVIVMIVAVLLVWLIYRQLKKWSVRHFTRPTGAVPASPVAHGAPGPFVGNVGLNRDTDFVVHLNARDLRAMFRPATYGREFREVPDESTQGTGVARSRPGEDTQEAVEGHVNRVRTTPINQI